jgi:hypothetical protein
VPAADDRAVVIARQQHDPTRVIIDLVPIIAFEQPLFIDKDLAPQGVIVLIILGNLNRPGGRGGE